MGKRQYQKPIKLSEWAYKSIKERIVNNEITPGDQLNIEKLSDDMGISRTPIREALLRLLQEGFVVSFSNVGFFVCGITRDDFDDIFELRQLIEAYAVVRFIEKCKDHELLEVLEINKQCKEAAEAGDVKAFNSHDVELHGMFIKCLGNKKMRYIYDDVADLLYRLRLYALRSTENIKQSLIEHENLIHAINEKDSVAGKLAMENHITNIRCRLEKFIDFEDEILR